MFDQANHTRNAHFHLQFQERTLTFPEVSTSRELYKRTLTFLGTSILSEKRYDTRLELMTRHSLLLTPQKANNRPTLRQIRG